MASTARAAFAQLLLMPTALLELDKAYDTKLRQGEALSAGEVLESQALKGGATVFMVAALESYLKAVFSEYIFDLDSQYMVLDLTSLVDNIWTKGVRDALNLALKGPRYGANQTDPLDRTLEIQRVCSLIHNGRLDWNAFSDTQGNPNEDCLKIMFKRVGVPDVMTRLQADYVGRHPIPQVSETFVRDKLGEVISRRNTAAHNAVVPQVAHNDLLAEIVFLGRLADSIDWVLEQHIARIKQNCSRRPT